MVNRQTRFCFPKIKNIILNDSNEPPTTSVALLEWFLSEFEFWKKINFLTKFDHFFKNFPAAWILEKNHKKTSYKVGAPIKGHLLCNKIRERQYENDNVGAWRTYKEVFKKNMINFFPAT